MADRVTLDFENNMITWDTDVQQGTENCPDLAERKEAILKAMGFESVNFSPVVDAVNAFMNGKISKDDLMNRFAEFERE